MLGYNIGENALQAAIEAHGTRDGWRLVREGLKTDRDYLPKLMAAILVMRNQETLAR